jgi:hypothetical protein
VESTDLSWRKPSYSENGGASCVEVAGHRGVILVRDTKQHGSGPVLSVPTGQWRRFVATVKAGEGGR